MVWVGGLSGGLVWGGLDLGRDGGVEIEILDRWDIDGGGGGGGCGGGGRVGTSGVYSVQYGNGYSARRRSGRVSMIVFEGVCSRRHHP